MTIEEACGACLRDLEARNIRKSSRANYRTLFRQLHAFANESGLREIEDIDRDAMRRWRGRWECAHSTQSKRLKLLKAFFRFARGRTGSRNRPCRAFAARSRTPSRPSH